MKRFGNLYSYLWMFLVPLGVYATPIGDLPVPTSGWDEMQNVPHGEVESNINYQTQDYGTQVHSIYFPPGYSTDKEYPVLYLQHGITDDQTTWTNGSKGGANRIMDNLYAHDKAIPMVINMVEGATGAQGDFNAFSKFEDVLLYDLIPHTESTYSVSTNPSHFFTLNGKRVSRFALGVRLEKRALRR